MVHRNVGEQVRNQPSVHKTKQAVSDLAAIAAFLGETSLELELRFLDAAQRTFSKLAKMPELGARREFVLSSLQGIRMWPILEFPRILIFYRFKGNRLTVIRVLPSARDIISQFLE